MDERKTPEQAWADFKSEVGKVFEPPMMKLLVWMDLQLRRSPRFYAWLSK